MKVRTEGRPKTALIPTALEKVDFTDTFSTTNHRDDLEVVSRKIFGKNPVWINILFRIRNFFARLIGLNTDPPKNLKSGFEPGSFISFFRVYEVTDNEVILGADDSHLKFRVSIYNSKSKVGNIKVTTLVEYLNRKGKIYMFFIKPFHNIVVRQMVKQAYVK